MKHSFRPAASAARSNNGSTTEWALSYPSETLHDTMVPDSRTTVTGFDTRFHQLEQWRERLIEGDAEAMSEICSQYPDVDRPRLRQLIRQAAEEKALDQQGAHFRKLFQFLKQLDD